MIKLIENYDSDILKELGFVYDSFYVNGRKRKPTWLLLDDVTEIIRESKINDYDIIFYFDRKGNFKVTSYPECINWKIVIDKIHLLTKKGQLTYKEK